jgi:pyruvate/2-oxoacid:ferredoxin oxidoreductase beta subunit
MSKIENKLPDEYIQRNTIPPTSRCSGCTAPLIARHAFDVLGRNTVWLVVASCGANWGKRIKVTGPLGYCCFPSGGAAATGVYRGFKSLGKKFNVVMFAGDGGTYDIGLQALSAAAERGENIIWICCNNEAYMLTGVQRSGATPIWAYTTTTPVGEAIQGKQRPKKDIIGTMEDANTAYIATASMAYLADFKKKISKAMKISTDEEKGLSFINVLHTCPTGWRYDPSRMIEYSKLAVETNWWPLYEIENNEFRFTYKPRETKPVSEFIKGQGRFRHLNDDQIEDLQMKVNDKWNKLLKRAD